MIKNNYLRHRWVGLVLVFSPVFCACAAPRDSEDGKPRSLFGSLAPSGEFVGKSEGGKLKKSAQTDSQAQNSAERGMTLKKIDSNAWRTGMPANVAFQTLTRILSQSYVIGQVDRKQMTLATEWDKFLIDGRVFRNRVSVGVFPVSARSTEIVVRNSVEYYEGDNSVTLKESNWIPTADLTDEVQRIVGALERQGAAYARR